VKPAARWQVCLVPLRLPGAWASLAAVRPFGEASLRLARRAAEEAETRRGVAVVFVVSLAVWWLQALIIPLGPGRDFGTYLGGYLQLFHGHPIDLGYLLGRTPIATVVVGGLLDFAGGALAEPVMSVLYAGSIVAWFLAARTFGGKAALLTAVILVVYPGYGILFHELSSDSVVAAAFAGWTLLLTRVLLSPTAARFALVGTGVGILALIRPVNQVLLALAVLPLLLLRAPLRARVVSAVAFLVPALVLLAAWTVHNGLRYDNYTLARGGNATVPFYRTFVTDKIVEPSNGPASQELAEAIRRDLLTKEPYLSYGIDLNRFFGEASSRMQEDLVALADREKGWKSNDRWLRDVGVEAVRAHPARYARGVTRTMWGMLTQGLYRSLSSGGGGTGAASGTSDGDGETVVINGRTLPKPSEGEAIPAAHEGGVSTPDGSIYTVWTSPSDHHLVFVHPGDEERYDALHRRMDELSANLPARDGSRSLANRLNQASRWFPPPLLWLLLGLGALLLRWPRGALALATTAAAALAVILLSALGLPAEPHYTVPVAPAFVFLAAGALFAPRREHAPAGWRARLLTAGVTARPFAGIAAGLVAAVWAVQIYFSKIDGAFDAGQAPQDLAVFLKAAGKVLDGSSPYSFNGDQTYAYPPLVAVLAAPFHPLSAGVATLLWLLLSLAAIAGALWLLGVRDWRCYALVAAYPVTRSAVGLGTVGPLLLLALAAAWRWRDQLLQAGAAVGAAVALKLFLWPLAVWLALTGRLRAALAGIGFGLALALVPWAVIGFDGLGGYPGLLRHLSRDEATSSYSVVALSVRAHLPEAAGVVLSLLIAAALLGAAAWVAREQGWAPRDRDVATLTLVLAAGLAASPIVWVHYFLLLLVPLALTRPRLSPLWFVPLAYYPLGEHEWPAGDAGKLALALVTTLVLLVVPLAGYARERARGQADDRPRLFGRRDLTAGGSGELR
jgi:glycosyl transferase family 87